MAMIAKAGRITIRKEKRFHIDHETGKCPKSSRSIKKADRWETLEYVITVLGNGLGTGAGAKTKTERSRSENQSQLGQTPEHR
jgi:hypothetical protein